MNTKVLVTFSWRTSCITITVVYASKVIQGTCIASSNMSSCSSLISKFSCSCMQHPQLHTNFPAISTSIRQPSLPAAHHAASPLTARSPAGGAARASTCRWVLGSSGAGSRPSWTGARPPAAQCCCPRPTTPLPPPPPCACSARSASQTPPSGAAAPRIPASPPGAYRTSCSPCVQGVYSCK